VEGGRRRSAERHEKKSGKKKRKRRKKKNPAAVPVISHRVKFCQSVLLRKEKLCCCGKTDRQTVPWELLICS
jgi:hypothetical protein